MVTWILLCSVTAIWRLSVCVWFKTVYKTKLYTHLIKDIRSLSCHCSHLNIFPAVKPNRKCLQVFLFHQNFDSWVWFKDSRNFYDSPQTHCWQSILSDRNRIFVWRYQLPWPMIDFHSDATWQEQLTWSTMVSLPVWRIVIPIWLGGRDIVERQTSDLSFCSDRIKTKTHRNKSAVTQIKHRLRTSCAIILASSCLLDCWDVGGELRHRAVSHVSRKLAELRNEYQFFIERKKLLNAAGIATILGKCHKNSYTD